MWDGHEPLGQEENRVENIKYLPHSYIFGYLNPQLVNLVWRLWILDRWKWETGNMSLKCILTLGSIVWFFFCFLVPTIWSGHRWNWQWEFLPTKTDLFLLSSLPNIVRRQSISRKPWEKLIFLLRSCFIHVFCYNDKSNN